MQVVHISSFIPILFQSPINTRALRAQGSSESAVRKPTVGLVPSNFVNSFLVHSNIVHKRLADNSAILHRVSGREALRTARRTASQANISVTKILAKMLRLRPQWTLRSSNENVASDANKGVTTCGSPGRRHAPFGGTPFARWLVCGQLPRRDVRADFFSPRKKKCLRQRYRQQRDLRRPQDDV